MYTHYVALYACISGRCWLMCIVFMMHFREMPAQWYFIFCPFFWPIPTFRHIYLIILKHNKNMDENVDQTVTARKNDEFDHFGSKNCNARDMKFWFILSNAFFVWQWSIPLCVRYYPPVPTNRSNYYSPVPTNRSNLPTRLTRMGYNKMTKRLLFFGPTNRGPTLLTGTHRARKSTMTNVLGSSNMRPQCWDCTG